MPVPTPPQPPQQLSLFDEPLAPRAAPLPLEPAPAPPARPPSAPETPPAPPPPLQPLAFRHPRAQRELQLGEHRVAYALRRGRQRHIRFVIGADGLAVSAPRWVSQRDIDSGLQEKAQWILRKLHEARERSARLEAARIDWREGAAIPFLGETLILVIDPRCTGAQLHTAADTLPGVPRLTLHLGLPQAAGAEQVRERVQAWLQRQARRVFEERCAIYSRKLGVQMRRLALSSAGTRWGSASADGSIRLNWRLVHFALPVIDYVVTHELAHLREMNHSPAFWDVVRGVLPDYESSLSQLRGATLPPLE